MSPEDVIDVLSFMQAVDHRTVGEADVLAWHELIGDIPKDLAMQAVKSHYRERAGVWLEPAHIVAGARAIMNDRIERETREERETRIQDLDARLQRRIIEVAQIKSIDKPRRVFTRPSQTRAPSASTYLELIVEQARESAPAAPLTAADGDLLMCAVCGERELVAKQEAGRGVCDPCWSTVDRADAKSERSAS